MPRLVTTEFDIVATLASRGVAADETRVVERPSSPAGFLHGLACVGALGFGLAPIPAWAQRPVETPNEVTLEELAVHGNGTGGVGGGGRKAGDVLPTDGYLAKQSVSATRTDTPLREVPQSVVVVPREVLEDAGATRVDTALDLAGVGRANNFAGLGLSEFTIRGFATGEYYRNGFPINRGYPNSPDIVSIERIEVLKGPSAFLYGRGDPGGTFNIVSKQPMAERSFAIGTQYGSYNQKRSTFDATGALNADGTVTARITGAVEDNGSFRDFVSGDRYYIAPAIAWQMTPDTRITLDTEFISTSTSFDRGVVPVYGDLRVVPRNRNIGEPGLPPFRNDNALGQLRVEHKFDQDWVLNAGAQLLGGNIAGDAIQMQGLPIAGPIRNRTFDHRELTWSDLDLQINLAGKFETGFLRHTLLMGLEYDTYRYREVINRSVPGTYPFALDILNPRYGQPLPPLTFLGSNLLENTESFAGFIQDQIDITPRLHALVGVRVENIDLVSTTYATKEGTLNPAGVTTNKNETAATPRFGLTYDLFDFLSVYGSYARSFKPNTGTDRNFRPFDFQKGEGYELGAKFELLEGRLSATAALFDIARTNVLVPDTANQNFNVAAGEIRSRGFDLSFAGYLAPGWSVFGTYAYVDAIVSRGNENVPAGSQVPNIPENTFALQSVYEFQDGWLRGLGLGGGVKFVGSRWSGSAAPIFKVPQYTIYNLISYYKITKDVRVYLNVENLTDEVYWDRTFSNRYAYPGTPLTILGGVAARF